MRDAIEKKIKNPKHKNKTTIKRIRIRFDIKIKRQDILLF